MKRKPERKLELHQEPPGAVVKHERAASFDLFIISCRVYSIPLKPPDIARSAPLYLRLSTPLLILSTSTRYTHVLHPSSFLSLLNSLSALSLLVGYHRTPYLMLALFNYHLASISCR